MDESARINPKKNPAGIINLGLPFPCNMFLSCVVRRGVSVEVLREVRKPPTMEVEVANFVVEVVRVRLKRDNILVEDLLRLKC